jgi:anti-sigma B factor antagonist
MSAGNSNFQIEWHGQTLVVTPSRDVESLRWDLIEQAAEIVMEPLARMPAPMVVFDLSKVNYFASVFLSMLLRCHKHVRSKGGELVLSGPSPTARELLRVTALDTLWAIYDTRVQAIDALAV